MIERGLRHVKVAVDVRLESPVPLLVGNVFERLLMLLESRVVDENVELPELTDRSLDRRAAEPRVSDIAGNQQRAPAFAFHGPPGLFRVLLLFRQIEDRDVRALARKEDRDAAPDA